MNETRKTCITGKLPPPVGTSEWETFSQDSLCVDKTRMIKEIVDLKTRVALFTRPRRFGKTTALKMIRAVFEKRVDGKGRKVDTSYLFKDKKIWAAGAAYRKMQGRFPVIWLSFKDQKADLWDHAANKLAWDIGAEVSRHRESVNSTWDKGEKRERLRRVMSCTASVEELAESLGYLAEAVHAHWRVKPIILIDEYDQPISSASTFGYYDRMCSFMRVFLSSALKDNAHVEMGLMTGVLRVAKEGILSGLNNPDVYTVFNPAFSEYFGFTEDEVRGMAEYYGVPEKMDEIRAWYDGYDFGGTEIYNPWSVLNYFKQNCRPGPYWLDTSSNDLITEIVSTYPHDTAKTLEGLLKGETPRVPMAAELGPYKFVRNRADTLYALLLSAGYVKAVSPVENQRCSIAIPNLEIRQVFEGDIISKLSGANGGVDGGAILDAFHYGDVEMFRRELERFLVESTSYFDAAAEGFYHGLVLGLLAILRPAYRVKSNGESGEGRYDLMLRPVREGYPGYVIEIKAARRKNANLKNLAAAALRQIKKHAYRAELEAEGCGEIVTLGLAFRGKKAVLRKG
ncbi:MAG: AAA family ATPase [bacterium]|nr:AAA family ATPase [Candidatus Colisoma equi]